MDTTKTETDWDRNFYECLPCMSFILDSAAVILLVNQFAASRLGYTPEELQKKSIFNFVYGEDREQLNLEFTTFFNVEVQRVKPLSVASWQCRLVCQDGSILAVKISARTVLGKTSNESIVIVCEEIPLQAEETLSKEICKIQKKLINSHSFFEENLAEKTADLMSISREIKYDIAARRQTKTSLHKSKLFYRYIVEKQTEIIGCFSDLGIIYFVNIAYSRYFGISRKKLIGSHFLAFVPDEDKQKIKYHIGCLNYNKPTGTIEHRVVLPNGEIRWQERSDRAIFDRDKKIIAFQSVGRDITERKIAEAALRESQEKYRVIFDIFPIGISLTDRTGKTIEYNQAYENILGSSNENINRQLIDAENWQILKKDGTKILLKEFALSQWQENKTPEDVEICILRNQNEATWISFKFAPIPLENYGVAIAHIDITEQKQTAEEREKTLSLLRATLESTADGIIAFSLERKLVCLNQKFIQMWQITDTIIAGHNYEDYLHFIINSMKNPETMNKRIRELSNQSEVKSYDIVELKNGKIFEHYTQPQLIGEKIVGRVWSFRDITYQERAKEALWQQAEAERLLGRMAERIRRSLRFDEILKTTATEVRQFLATDRVIIYRFQPDWSGVVVVEAVGAEWTRILNTTIADPCFGESMVRLYQKGRTRAIADINVANLMPCHFNLLAQFQVRANLVVPILQGEQLWGLLIAHHCSNPREWQPLEIDLLKQLATQVGIAIQQAELYQQLETANQTLLRLASLDGLTQLANRRRFDEYLEQEWRRLCRDRLPLSLIMCDVDCFKLYNDTYGHLAGDLCLQQVADAIRRAVNRPVDLVARYGGEEFAVILPNTTAEGAVFIAQTIRENVSALKQVHTASCVSNYVTVSLGVASTFPDSAFSPDRLIGAADEALYRAKALGRDRFFLHNLD
ncbi:diguanylate cyclase domain-containing protein [Aerosakkonema sp. BLCC-F183]|uniref:diguanylate cyclase domain-containing protein n=1 Tax=Aerosakkonema sp. BLCC-F183 TaxID=3342834 RepID=UPI0035B9D06C